MPRPRLDGKPTAPANKRALTKNFVEKTRPMERPFLIWDTRQRGLALAVRPTGRKLYKVVYAFRGRVRWYHLADAAAISLDDARKLAGRVMYQVAEGSDPQAQRKAERSAGTFDELADRYLAEHAKKKNKSWAQGDKLVRRHLRPRWGKLLAADIGRSEVKAFMRATEDAPAVANQTLAAASAIFEWALKEEVAGVTANPCRGVARNPMIARERVLSESELPRFWHAFDDAGLIRGTALKLILLTGQRPGEVSHMRVAQIDDQWWTLPGLPDATGWPGVKNKKTHRVWLPAPVMELIADLLDGEGFVFPGERGGAVKGLDESMREICKALGVPRATPHDLRRTNGTTITGLGFGRAAMNRIQNHIEGGIGSVYDRHEYAEENKRVMEATAARILMHAEGRPAAENVAYLPAR